MISAVVYILVLQSLRLKLYKMSFLDLAFKMILKKLHEHWSMLQYTRVWVLVCIQKMPELWINKLHSSIINYTKVYAN